MKSDTKAKWLAALRSGNYKQCIGSMHKVSEDGVHRYCCLGVLADQIRQQWFEGDTQWTAASLRSHLIAGLCSVTSFTAGADKLLGLNQPFVKGDTETTTIQEELIDMNDKEEASFDDIADWIEANVEVDDE